MYLLHFCFNCISPPTSTSNSPLFLPLSISFSVLVFSPITCYRSSSVSSCPLPLSAFLSESISLRLFPTLYQPFLPVPYSSLSPHFCNSFPQSPAFFFIYLYCKLTQFKKKWIRIRIKSIWIRNPECRHAIKPSESVYTTLRS
jgi:hypothetical protein